MEGPYEIEGLYCSLCFHDLHNSSYKICQHPLIEVPLCILCLDTISAAFNCEVDIADICSWCGEGGELLGCDECEHLFCRECISNNLGEAELLKVVESSRWKCYVCDSSPLDKFHKALKAGEEFSIYNERKNEVDGISEEQAAIERLTVMVAETILACGNLDSKNLDEKKKEFEEAFERKDFAGQERCTTSFEEELDLYRSYWQRHYDIVLRQEADLFEQVSFYGYNPKELPCYKNQEANLGMTDEDYMKMNKMHSTVNAVSDSSATVAAVDRKVEYVEEVVEEGNDELLEKYTLMAESDGTVLKFAAKPEVDKERYPESFERVVPRGVLKALYYGSVRSAEIQNLIQKFSIPAHIVLIMSVADCNHEGCTDRWEIASRVHPSVRKALYELSSPVDQSILCAHYKLGEEYCSITDFGDAEDICNIYTESHKGVNPHVNEMNPKNLNELAALESETATSKLTVQQLASVVQAQRKNRTVKGSSCPAGDGELALQVKTIVSYEGEDEDEIKLQRQRVVVSSGVKFSCADDRLEAVHQQVKIRTRNTLRGSTSDSSNTATDGDDTRADSGPNVDNNKSRRHRTDNRKRRVRATLVSSSSSESSSASSEEEDGVDDELMETEEGWVKIENTCSYNGNTTIAAAVTATATSVAMDAIEEQRQDEEEEGDVADDVTVEGYWDKTELMELEEKELSQKEEIEKKLPVATSASAKKSVSTSAAAAAAKVVDLTWSDDEGVEIVEKPSKTGRGSDSGSGEESDDNDSSSEVAVDGSDEATFTSSNSGDNSDEDLNYDDDDEVFVVTKRKTRSEKTAVCASDKKKGGRLKKSNLKKDGDDEASEGSDLESPLLSRKRPSPTSTPTVSRTTTTTAAGTSSNTGGKLSLYEQLMLKNSSSSSSAVKPALPDVITKSSTNTFDVSGRSFDIFKSRRPKITISKDELLNNHFAAGEESFSLNANSKSSDLESVCIPKDLAEKLKEHQKEGLQFLWNNTMEASFKQLHPKKDNSISSGGGRAAKDHGCLLAHCMGLGKTFSIITYSITLLCNPAVTGLIDPIQPAIDDAKAGAATVERAPKDSPSDTTNAASASKTSCDSVSEVTKKPLINSILIIVPPITVENWIAEFKKWTPEELIPLFRVSWIDANFTIKERISRLKRWHTEGGVMVMGYAMYRTLTTKAMKAEAAAESSNSGVGSGSKKAKASYSEDVKECRKYLVEPGADLVVADEAHLLSNKDSMLTKVFNEMRTKRRIALTGSPLQNNLLEYYCMVEWVKKGHLAHNQNRFKELFVDPIKAGEAADAHKYDVQQMRKKVFILNKKLSSIVHRKDFSILIQSLKMKRQYILCIKMTTFQQYLYRYFLVQITSVFGKATLFKTYQTFLRLWNHPFCTVAHSIYERERLAAEAAKEANGNNKKSSAASKPKSPVYLRDMIRELSSTFNHFRVHGTRLLAEMESVTKEIESKILKRTVGIEEFPVDEDQEESGLADGDRDEDVVSETASLKRPLSAPSLDDAALGSSGASGSSGVASSSGSNVAADIAAVTADASMDGGGATKKQRTDSVVDLISRSTTPASEDGDLMDVVDFASPGDKFVSFASPGDKLISATNSPRGGGDETGRSKGIAYELFPESDEDDKPAGRTIFNSPVPSAAAVNRPPLLPPALKTESSVKSDVSLKSEAKSESTTADPIKSMAVDWWRHVPSNSKTEAKAKKAIEDSSVVDLTLDDEDEDEEAQLEPMTEMDLLQLSNKLITFLSLLVLSIQQGDKVLMFSQSLYTLNMVEQFLRMKYWGDVILMGKNGEMSVDRSERARFSNWINEREFMRIDGSTKDRQRLIDRFNSSDKYKLFMVCTKAGNMGINLYTANRVVIFDSSWNPVHDLQAISRSYRYGQKKEVFVYRMVAAGSMEEVIYKRQMLKQALAARVVDAQMPDNQEQAGELMDFDKKQSDGGPDDAKNGSNTVKLSETVNQDKVLLQFVERHSSVLSYIEDQEVLLEDNVDSHLNEEEQKAAEAEYEKELARENRLNAPYVPPSVISPPVTASMIQSVNSGGSVYSVSERATDYQRAYNRAMDLLVNREMQQGMTPQGMAMQIAKRYVDDKAAAKWLESQRLQQQQTPTAVPVVPNVTPVAAAAPAEAAGGSETVVDKRTRDYNKAYQKAMEQLNVSSQPIGMAQQERMAHQAATEYADRKAANRAVRTLLAGEAASQTMHAAVDGNTTGLVGADGNGTMNVHDNNDANA